VRQTHVTGVRVMRGVAIVGLAALALWIVLAISSYALWLWITEDIPDAWHERRGVR
jgi:hypothetical protein